MSEKTTIRFSEEDRDKIELLKRIYQEKTTAKMIKRLISMHYEFWLSIVEDEGTFRFLVIITKLEIIEHYFNICKLIFNNLIKCEGVKNKLCPIHI